MNPTHSACRTFSILAALALAALFTGCDGGSAGSPAVGDVEQVVVAIAEVPPDVNCVRITGAGSTREVVRLLDVIPGTPVSESFSGLPVGAVVFRAEAFAAACSSISKTTVPAWVSMEESVNVSLTRTASVALTLYRNGRAKVSLAFVDEQSGPDGGAGPDSGEAGQ